MKIGKEQVNHIGNLSKLIFTEEEKDEISNELSNIVNSLDIIAKVDTNNINPTINIFPINNVFREDKIITSMNRDELLKNAPNHSDGCFSVPLIVE